MENFDIHKPQYFAPLAKDDLNAVEIALDYVSNLRLLYPDLIVESEIDVVFPQKVVAADRAGGVVDIFCYSPSARAYWIIDYKHGVEHVEAEDNKQLLFYITCIMWHISYVECKGVIIQPNSLVDPKPRHISVEVWQIIEFQDKIEQAIRICESDNPHLVAGSHCRLCKCAAVCPELEKGALAVVPGGAIYRSLPAPADIGLERCANILSASDILKTWLKAVEGYCYARAAEGQHVPGFKLVNARGRRQWIEDEARIVHEIEDMTKYDVNVVNGLRPAKLLPLTEAEKLVLDSVRRQHTAMTQEKAVEDARKRLAFLTVKTPSSTVTLVPESDPRPSLKRGAAEDFSGVRL
jgi:hypothetical protein